MTAFAGYSATINGACNSGTKWSVEATTELLDATTFCSGGYKEFVEGLKGGTFTIDALAPITVNGSVSFANDAVTITGTVMESSATYEVSVDGLCTFTYAGSFSGEFTVT